MKYRTDLPTFQAYHCPPDAFLPLDYTSHRGCQPIAASSQLYLHPWCQHDFAWLAGSVEIEPVIGDDSWHVWCREISANDASPFTFCRCDDAIVNWWLSPSFPRFEDAEAFAAFAWQRWQATSRFSASGLELQSHLDHNRNPWPRQEASQ